MTFDEAIEHEKEVAKEIYVEAMLCHANPDDEKLDDCIEDGRYHERLAEWLEELKEYKNKNPYQKYVDNIANTLVDAIKNLSIEDINMYKIGYNKAIDDFKKILTIEKIKEYAESDGFININNCSLMIFDIAEQLKEKIE